MQARLFLNVRFHDICLAFAVAPLSLQLLATAHDFETLGSDRFDGSLRCCFFVVWLFVLSSLSAERFAGSLASGS